MLLVILFYKVPAVFNIFVVKYKSCFPIDTIDSLSQLFYNNGWLLFLREHSYFHTALFLFFHEIFHTFKLHGIWRFTFKKTLDKNKDALSVMIWPNCGLLRSHTQFKGRWLNSIFKMNDFILSSQIIQFWYWSFKFGGR